MLGKYAPFKKLAINFINRKNFVYTLREVYLNKVRISFISIIMTFDKYFFCYIKNHTAALTAVVFCRLSEHLLFSRSWSSLTASSSCSFIICFSSPLPPLSSGEGAHTAGEPLITFMKHTAAPFQAHHTQYVSTSVVRINALSWPAMENLIFHLFMLYCELQNTLCAFLLLI